jgi:hypothetical protein
MSRQGLPDLTTRPERYHGSGGLPPWFNAAWSSAGISTEKIDLFLAPYANGDRICAGGGLASKDENIQLQF